MAEIALRLPPGSQLVLASRARPSLPEALSRPRGRLLELGSGELAMDEREARALLEQAGARLDDAEVAELLDRTGGWPVELYLASFGRPEEGMRDKVRAAVAGNGHPVASQPPASLLSRLSEPTVRFLTRTAVLDQLSGPLCDAVLQVSGSQQVLESLAASNQLLVTVDRRHRWYRYHQLLRELLLAELERREPGLVPELHLRAAAWYERKRLPELAIEHGQAAGDADRVARLVAALAFPAYAGGRVETARRWFRFEDQGLVERYRGSRSSARRWRRCSATPRKPNAGRPRPSAGRQAAGPDSTLDGSLALLRTFLCRGGMAGMRADAAAAWADLALDDPWRATAPAHGGDQPPARRPGRAGRPDPGPGAPGRRPLGATPAASAALAERGPHRHGAPPVGGGGPPGRGGRRRPAGRPPGRLRHGRLRAHGGRRGRRCTWATPPQPAGTSPGPSTCARC